MQINFLNEGYPVKTIDKVLQKLIDKDTGESMIDFKCCYSERGLYGENTVVHCIALKDGYYTQNWVMTWFGQLADNDLFEQIKTEEIWKRVGDESDDQLETKLVMDSDGNPKNFNPFCKKQNLGEFRLPFFMEVLWNFILNQKN